MNCFQQESRFGNGIFNVRNSAQSLVMSRTVNQFLKDNLRRVAIKTKRELNFANKVYTHFPHGVCTSAEIIV